MDVTELSLDELLLAASATKHCSPELLGILLAKGADPNHREEPSGLSPLHVAREETKVQLLLAAGADPAATTVNLWTPLHFAQSGVVATLLLDAGASLDAIDDMGFSPMDRERSEAVAVMEAYQITRATPPARSAHVRRL